MMAGVRRPLAAPLLVFLGLAACSSPVSTFPISSHRLEGSSVGLRPLVVPPVYSDRPGYRQASPADRQGPLWREGTTKSPGEQALVGRAGYEASVVGIRTMIDRDQGLASLDPAEAEAILQAEPSSGSGIETRRRSRRLR